MKKLIVFSTLLIVLSSCNSNGSSESNMATGDTTDKAGMTNPSAIDTTVHPNGITNGSVISTDTAAMNVQKSVDKAKAADKNQ